MADDLASLVTSGATAAGELHELIELSRKQFDLPPYVNPDEYEAWKQEKVNNTTQQRLLRDQTLELERTYIGRERYLERLSTYSTTFITNITPVSPDQCAMHGWIDTKERLVVAGAKVFRLSCEHCSYTLDVPDLTGFNPNFTSVKRIYSVYPSLLNKGHSEVCFWNTASCHVSVCAFPLVTTSDAMALLETQGSLFKQCGTGLPLVQTDLDRPKIRMLHRVIKSIEGVDVFAFPQPQVTTTQEIAYLLPMFGWHLMNECNGPLLKCTSCFRHVLIPNYHQISDLSPSYGTDGTSFDHATPPIPSLTHSPRQECIKGAFDLINEHRPYCPWRNRDTARIHIKDSFFVPPKQPLNGCEWMLEIICKEWFQLTAEDEKHPRHDELRRAAERHITTSLVKNRWMTEDLTKYALSKSRLKHSISETGGGPYSDEQSLNKRQKLQHEISVEGIDEQSQQLDQQNVTTPENKLVGVQSADTTDLQLVTTSTNPEPLSPAQKPDHLEHVEDEGKPPSDEQPPPVTESPVQKSQHASPEPTAERSDLFMQPDTATPMEEITMDAVQAGTTDQVALNKPETKEEEGLDGGVPAVNDRGLDELALQLDDETTASGKQDSAVDEIPPSAADIAASDDTLSKDTTTAPTYTNDAIITSSNNEDMATDTKSDKDNTGVIMDLKDSATELDDELDKAEAEELLQHDYKEDFGLTPIGDGVSTPGSWGLVETDNGVAALDEDTKSEGDIVESTETREGENTDGEQKQPELDGSQIQQQQQQQQPEELYDLQEETEELAPATNDDYDVNMDMSTTNDTDLLYDEHPEPTSPPTEIDSKILDQDATPDTAQDDASNMTTQEPSNDTTNEDDLGHEKEVEQVPETTTPDTVQIEIVEPMDLDQDEEQEAEDTTELDLHEYNPVVSLDAPESVGAATDNHQPLEPTEVDESELQLDNVGTPQDLKEYSISTSQELDTDHVMTPVDLHSDHVMLPQDTTEDNATHVVNNGETASLDTTGQSDQPLNQDAEKEHAITDQDEDQHENEENMVLPQQTSDESSLTTLQKMDDDIGTVVSGHAQLDLENSEGDDNGTKGDERTPDKEELEDVIPPQDDTHTTIESTELDNGAVVLESNEADTSNGLTPTPVIPEQEHGDIEEDVAETPAVDEYPVEMGDDNDLQINDAIELSDSKPSVIVSEKAVENEEIKDEQLEQGIDGAQESPDTLAQESAALIPIEVTEEEDTYTTHVDLTETDGLKDEDNQDGDYLGQPDQDLETEEAPTTPSVNQHDNEHNSDFDDNDDLSDSKDLGDDELLDHNDGVEDAEMNDDLQNEHDSTTLDGPDHDDNGDDSLDQYSTELTHTVIATGDQSTDGMDTPTNEVDQVTTDQPSSFEDITTATDATATETVTSPAPSSSQQDDIDLDNEVSLTPTAATPITTTPTLPTLHEGDDIAQDNSEMTRPASPASSHASADVSTVSNPTPELPVGSNDNYGGQKQQDHDSLVIGDEAEDDEEENMEDDGNTMMTDSLTQPSSLNMEQQHEQPTDTDDHDMLDQHDEDQLKQYEEDNGGNDDHADPMEE
ncbi:hypothetical protein [Absidia glauca]|uniref:C3HC-type domain-containing protein n=1 Tax=Absidia glauca TaxID=4829 RepID=A0A168R1S6_ABSGL|nr:hypothetical protein [Absidia glauca]